MLIDFCKNGHVRTEENTSFVRENARNRTRKVCLDCRRESRRKGTPTMIEMSRQATTYLHEDLEDLLSYGSTYNEIMERSGFHDWSTMLRSLKSRNRQDLIDAIRDKREKNRTSGVASSRTYGGKTTKGRHNRTQLLPEAKV